jgi:DNA modification methylase
MSKTRQLWAGDNLTMLADMQDASAGLVYLDPPFASSRLYEATVSTRRRKDNSHRTVAFTDHWTMDSSERRDTLTRLERQHPSLAELVGALSAAPDRRDLGAYLLMMIPRLLESHRILHAQGSIFIHCDPTASHYLKVILDSIFGAEHFRNEIIWKRTHAHSASRRCGPVHDVILFYSRSSDYTWNPLYTAYEHSYVEKHFRQVDQRGQYQLITCTAPGDRQGTRAHYEWRGQLPPPGRHWAWQFERMTELESAGLLVYSSNGVPRLKRYVDDGPGLALQDLWLDIRRLDAHSDERVGYETQKPVALLERIISTTTNGGDLVVDPFCGTGTTLVAAERLGRSWVGADLSLLGMSYALARTRQEAGKHPILLNGFPDSSAAAMALLSSDPQTFGVWGASMLATLVDRKAFTSTVASGTGQLTVQRRRVEVMSWVPLRSEGLETSAPRQTRRRLPQVGLLLKIDQGVNELRRWLETRLPALPVQEIDLGQLIVPASLRTGMPAGLTQWASAAS